ncbi:MAG: hypothetical protein J0L92_12985, partial [Deltaproteobacteria bacterium]|nr:hypothetical protein [Deltaproteobacteria bacterium]
IAPITEPAPPRHSYVAPVHAARTVRPMTPGGPPPTVIRDLDALFAKDGRKSAPTPPRASTPSQPSMQPAQFAQALLQKISADFTPSRPPPPAPVPAMPAAYASPAFTAPPAPQVVAFVPSPLTALAMERTAELALPDDDEDVAQLVPWYRRLWNKLVAR